MERRLAVAAGLLALVGCGGGDEDVSPGLSESLEDRRTLNEIEESIDFDYRNDFGVTVREVGCVPESARKAVCLVEFRKPDSSGQTQETIEVTWDGTEYVWSAE